MWGNFLGNKGPIRVNFRESGREIFGGTKGRWKRHAARITRLDISTEIGEGVHENIRLTLIS